MIAATSHEPRATSHGFTLMEVFFALVILAGSLFVFMRMNNDNLRRIRDAREQHLAGLLLQMKLSEVEAEGYPANGTRSGDFGEAGYPDYRYEVNVNQAGFGEATFTDVREAQVDILWGGDDHPEMVSAMVYLLDTRIR